MRTLSVRSVDAAGDTRQTASMPRGKSQPRRSHRKIPKRTATRKEGRPATPRVRIAIATAPNSGASGPSLADEIRLVRSAVLYADEVELVSPGAEMLGSMAALASGDEGDLLEFFLGLDDATISGLGDQQLPENWREMVRSMSALTNQDWDQLSELTGETIPDDARTASDELRSMLSGSLGEMRETVDEMLESAGAGEITPAIEAGIVRVSPTLISPAGDGDSDEMVRRYVEKLRRLLGDPRTHLLLDESIAELVRGLIEDGQVDPHQLSIANAGEAAVGNGLIARLPAFAGTPIDELLDLRRDLEDPLSRYRRSIAGLATKLRVGPFDEHLGADIDHLYVSEVDPALRDLQDGFAEHGLVREVARSLATDIKAVVTATVGPGIYLGAASLADINGWLTLAGSAATALVPVGQVTAKAVLEKGRQDRAMQKHDLFYLFEIDRRLSEA
jgi:hypothetical protein